jgi:hypothetical protein
MEFSTVIVPDGSQKCPAAPRPAEAMNRPAGRARAGGRRGSVSGAGAELPGNEKARASGLSVRKEMTANYSLPGGPLRIRLG